MTHPPELLPALPDSLSLDALGDSAARIILCCERAKEWLATALANDDIEQIVELKSQAEAIRVYTMQKQLGKDAELSASEIVRRAERCIGLAIRKGQAEGKINKVGDQRSKCHKELDLVSPRRLLGDSADAIHDIYTVTDSVTDEAFDAAIETAKGEGNLSRANVVRKVKGEGAAHRWANLAALAAEGHTSSQIASEIGVTRETVLIAAKRLGVSIHADRVVGKIRRIDHNRVIRAFTEVLESLVPSCDQIEPEKIDPEVLAECLSIMDDSMRAINRLRARIRKGVSNG